MSAIHVLDQNRRGSFRCVLHSDTPAGNNSSGFPWAEVLVASESAGPSVLSEGSGPGQTTALEIADVAAGTVVEHVVRLHVGTLAELNAAAGMAMDAHFAKMVRRLGRWGLTVG